MIDKRTLFLQHVAQTSVMPLQLEVDRASGIYIYDRQGKEYMDLNSGICVSSLGHCHPAVVEAVKNQCENYMHTMVYGEHIQGPQVDYAANLAANLPKSLDNIYFLNSGSEVVEAAIKLARKYTGRGEVISFGNAYHGSTLGAECLRSDETFKRNFRPLIPGFRQIPFNDLSELNTITHETACVIAEPVQAEAGIRLPKEGFLKALRNRCNEVGALLVLDEIQTGFGRTGSLFAFEKFGIVPDILLIGKGMGGGMPISALISDSSVMQTFSKYPALGHITTFGGHPVNCAAGNATLKTLINHDILSSVEEKGRLFKKQLVHPLIVEVRGTGLMMAVEIIHKRYMKHVVEGLNKAGILVDWFLFCNDAFRLAPPLIITPDQITDACATILEVLDGIERR